MPAATLEMSTTNALTRHTSADVDVARSVPMVLVAGDGKRRQQESLDSARAACIAVLATAAMLLAILTGTVMLLIG
jgi:hypothetical protein